MDSRVREDDRSNVILGPYASFLPLPVIPALLRVIPAEPALDLIGGQESIPEYIPTSGRRLVQRAPAQVLHIGPAHQ